MFNRINASVFVSAMIILSGFSVGLVLQNYLFNARLSAQQQVIILTQLDTLQLKASTTYLLSKKTSQKIGDNEIFISNNQIKIKMKAKQHTRTLLKPVS